MKIICTKTEFEAMMFALGRSTECPVVKLGKIEKTRKSVCSVGDLGMRISCEECIRQNIEWEITDNET